ncbi:SKI family transcriptional corepressor 2 [Paramormyrops kingsleyae]|uniref:SKI family transcriptional corepressor 2 n=1 Tax=Paramormyrops kingsleyae TaxID=1676925 RepID=A0A3B3QLD1_9TELE|nr:SKI family transcriptional corepressor 2 [Paramormyrops kingsleyae]XP_023664097.1 SKI family transcriptional corepressor 2 [Paramormyrops kingsleyae]XP_023664098.1 SKI family transcriptional corepressor 2 [Paramormyrops kingsleyae]
MEKALLPGPNDIVMATAPSPFQQEPLTPPRPGHPSSLKPNQVGQVILYGVPIVSLVIDSQERLCLAQISNTLLKNYSYNEIHNRRVALGITCVQCTPVQLEILRRAGAMPISSRRCGMITKREAERLCKSFLGENSPPKLPDNFAFDVSHECAWGCRGNFVPARYNSSRAKCIKCSYCNMYFSPNKFIFHSHRTPDAKYTQPDAANFNSWRRHLKLSDKSPPEDLAFAWEDVKAMFNGGSRKRALPSSHCPPMGSVKGVGSVLPHMIPPDLSQKRGRFDEDEDADAGGLSPRKHPRSYPVIPVPSKGFGVLQKFPTSSLFPGPYPFPAFGLCQQKKDDGESPGGQKNGGLSGLLWPSRKDAFYPPFCMFWPPRTTGGIPVPTYLQPQPGALGTLSESPSLRQAFLDLSEQGEAGAGIGANTRAGLFESECPPPAPEPRPASEGWLKLLDTPSLQARKANYHSAFRPVVKDVESIAKLHGGLEDFGSDRHLSPGTSCSYQSESGPDSDEEQEVDVETKQDEEESDFASRGQQQSQPCGLHLRGLAEGAGDRSKEPGAFAAVGPDNVEDKPVLAVTPPASLKEASPIHVLLEDTAYKNAHKNSRDGQIVFTTKESSSHSAPDENKDQSNFFVSETDPSGTEYWREKPGTRDAGDQSQEGNSPVSLKKDVENMEKEELQKVLLEQIDLRRRLEQEFHALKGSGPFPVFHNFHDQMKRDLAYREEMVQQLQMIPYANIIRKEKIGTHLNKS